ncbi:MAG: extracellular solute-binding protein [Anaerolineales bacterium]|nr:extracellular solute-binding protein [Anaerolineales bacterium]
MVNGEIGRYQIKRELGRGGMATVYLAHDPRFGRNVALKVLPSNFTHDPSFRGRFEREARTIAQLEHPAIVPVYDYGEHEGQPYLVMRYMPGGSLQDLLSAKEISLSKTVEICRRIAEALHIAHQKGIVHRDLKPGNILFDEYGNAYLADFGIVKLVEGTSTYTGSGVVGTPAYMSPEQAKGEGKIDGRSDIYALGVLFFYMATGRQPYESDTPMRIIMQHILEPIPDPLDVKPDLSPQAVDVIMHSMAKDPDERYQTTLEMVAAFDQITAKQDTEKITAIEAPVEPPLPEAFPIGGEDEPTNEFYGPERERKGVNWARLGFGALFVLLGVGIIGSAIWGVAQLGNRNGTQETTPTKEVVALVNDITPEPSPLAAVEDVEPVTIRWYVGLSSLSGLDGGAFEQDFVAAFNAQHGDRFQLELEVVDSSEAYARLQSEIDDGQVPNIIGPVGIPGLAAFKDSLLDLTPYIWEAGYDLSDFDPAQIEVYELTGHGQVSLPFSAFPSGLWYNQALFDEAGLAYPPQQWGAPYADGDIWDWDKLREMAMLLTIDANGRPAGSSGFDPADIVQFGFDIQSTHARGQATYFGAGSFVDADGTATLPADWADAFRWYYDAMWTDHFMPTDAYRSSDLFLQGNTFGSGKIAMSPQHLWYTCCVGEVDWNVAAIPAYRGEATAKLHVLSFGIMQDSANPDAAWEVLQLFLGEHAAELLAAYGGVPARQSLQADYLEQMSAAYPGVDFSVFVDGLAYADIPNHELRLSNHTAATARIDAFQNLYQSTPDLDLDAELENLVLDLNEIFQGTE